MKENEKQERNLERREKMMDMKLGKREKEI
jgi:hypothetical protein